MRGMYRERAIQYSRSECLCRKPKKKPPFCEKKEKFKEEMLLVAMLIIVVGVPPLPSDLPSRAHARPAGFKFIKSIGGRNASTGLPLPIIKRQLGNENGCSHSLALSRLSLLLSCSLALLLSLLLSLSHSLSHACAHTLSLTLSLSLSLTKI